MYIHVYTYVYAYAYTYAHTHTYTYTYTGTYTYTCTCTYAVSYICLHLYKCLCLYTHMQIFTCIYIYIYISIYIYTYIHSIYKDIYIYIYINIYIYMYIYIHIHTYIHRDMHAYIHTCIHTYIHKCIHPSIHSSVHHAYTQWNGSHFRPPPSMISTYYSSMILSEGLLSMQPRGPLSGIQLCHEYLEPPSTSHMDYLGLCQLAACNDPSLSLPGKTFLQRYGGPDLMFMGAAHTHQIQSLYIQHTCTDRYVLLSVILSLFLSLPLSLSLCLCVKFCKCESMLPECARVRRWQQNYRIHDHTTSLLSTQGCTCPSLIRT